MKTNQTELTVKDSLNKDSADHPLTTREVQKAFSQDY
jgi:hypothetical protein